MFPHVRARMASPTCLPDGAGVDPLALLSDWRLAGPILLGAALWVIRRQVAAACEPSLGGAPEETCRGRLESALPPAIEIIGFAGQDRHARPSGEGLVMHTMPGLRSVAVVIGLACLWMLLGTTYGVWMPPGWPSWAVAGATVLAWLGAFTFEARVDRDALTITHFVH